MPIGAGSVGNLRANGHPNGRPWRQLLCIACRRYFLESLGTIFHGKCASVDLIVHVIACLAEGLGIRGTARVFEMDPNTVLQWLVEAADNSGPSRSTFCMTCGSGRCNWMSCLRCSAPSGTARSGRPTPSSAWAVAKWVWVAMDPESKLLLAIDAGDRTLAMAQRVIHHVAQVLAPDCARCLSPMVLRSI